MNIFHGLIVVIDEGLLESDGALWIDAFLFGKVLTSE